MLCAALGSCGAWHFFRLALGRGAWHGGVAARPASQPSGPLPVGGHDVLWTATDASNNTASAWMRLAVRDTTPPVFGGVANVTLDFSAGAVPWAN